MTEKSKWSNAIGELIIGSNQIDLLLSRVYEKVFAGEFSKTWISQTFSDRIKKLSTLVEKSLKESYDQRLHRIDTEGLNYLKKILEEATSVVDVRNHVAHGSFIINCDVPEDKLPATEFSIARYHKNGLDILEYEEIFKRANECTALAHKFSRFLAVHEFRKNPASKAAYE